MIYHLTFTREEMQTLFDCVVDSISFWKSHPVELGDMDLRPRYELANMLASLIEETEG